MTVAILVIVCAILVLQIAALNFLRRISMDLNTILNQIGTLSADVDALIASNKPVDLQPVADALTALDDKVKAATPAAG